MVERLGIETQFIRKPLQVIFVERPPVFTRLLDENVIVVLPESILLGRTFAGLPRPLGFGTKKGKMHVPKTHLSGCNVLLFDLATRASGKLAAERSLEIAEFDQGDGSVRVAPEMAHTGQDGVHQGRAVLGVGLVL